MLYLAVSYAIKLTNYPLTETEHGQIAILIKRYINIDDLTQSHNNRCNHHNVVIFIRISRDKD